MKKLFILSSFVFVSMQMMAQAPSSNEITKKNSWLKMGLNAGVPVGDLADVSSFTLGVELKGQLMETNHVGIGLTTGYNHFFAKNNFSSFGIVPLGAFVRVYPKSEGFFAGLDGGYSIITNIQDAKGGVYLRPQLGYHNYDWNVFAYYNNIFRSNENGGNLAHVGIGATYNIRFN
ncbi:MAG: hypothetical protein QM791_10895 [Ferruginibacter sp.]